MKTDNEKDLPDPPDNDAFDLFPEAFQDKIDARMQRGVFNTEVNDEFAKAQVRGAWKRAMQRLHTNRRAFKPKLADAMQNPRKKQPRLREAREKS